VAVVFCALTGCNNEYNSGDRVLVAKFLYETKLEEPRRFDVVVFKYPSEPVKKGVPRNYIKRLLGLPGEILAIFFGQLFRIPAPDDGAPPYFDDLENVPAEQLDAQRKNLWEGRFTHSKHEKCMQWFQDGKFQPVRKPPAVMMAMRRIVYDNDFPARDLIAAKVPPRWQSAGDWGVETGGKSFRHGDKKKDWDWLTYQNLRLPRGQAATAPVSIHPQLITDALDYNSGENPPNEDFTALNWAGDLMLECDLTVTAPRGEFGLVLTRGIYQYQARWDLATGVCKLLRREYGSDKWDELAHKDTEVKKPGTHQLRFANFDSRLTVWVDGQLPFGDGHDYTPPELPRAEEKKLSATDFKHALARRCGPSAWDVEEPAKIGSSGADVQVQHVRLWRDTYYVLGAGRGQQSDGGFDLFAVDPERAQRERSQLRDALTNPNSAAFVRLKELDLTTFYVQPGHYLVLGDNSQSSSDSRVWGLVPERLLLGRALAIYFPFDRAGAIR
jgi:signal peptidase I